MITGLKLEEDLQLDKASSACHGNKNTSFSMKLSEETVPHTEKAQNAPECLALEEMFWVAAEDEASMESHGSSLC